MGHTWTSNCTTYSLTIPKWRPRWPTLSHGERKRVQVAVALGQEVHVLAPGRSDQPPGSASINGLETDLDSYDCALILVSHGPVFLDARVTTH